MTILGIELLRKKDADSYGLVGTKETSFESLMERNLYSNDILINDIIVTILNEIGIKQSRDDNNVN
jgi:hypothetical protein